MDAAEQLVFDSEVSVGVLGRGSEFVLIGIGIVGESFAAEAVSECVQRGFAYAGVLAVRNGEAVAQIASENPQAMLALLPASLAFARLVAEHLRPKPANDGVQWLDQLYALTDPRDERYENIAARLRRMTPSE